MCPPLPFTPGPFPLINFFTKIHSGPEKVVCCSLCLCMACAVLSSVSLVYLTFIVYMPAKRELLSGLLEVPVMCTTINMVETDQCE